MSLYCNLVTNPKGENTSIDTLVSMALNLDTVKALQLRLVYNGYHVEPRHMVHVRVLLLREGVDLI